MAQLVFLLQTSDFYCGGLVFSESCFEVKKKKRQFRLEGISGGHVVQPIALELTQVFQNFICSHLRYRNGWRFHNIE